jgi:hypothetical protein
MPDATATRITAFVMVTKGDVTDSMGTSMGPDPAAPRFDDRTRDEIAALRTRFERDAPQGFTDEDAYRFERITGALGAPSFPATREELLDIARAGGAPDAVMVSLRSVGHGSRFASYDELLLALGVGTAGRIDGPGAPARDPEGGAPSLHG